MTESDTMVAELGATLKAAKGLPEYLIVPPGWDPKTLPPVFGDGRLAGIKVVVSPHVPPGTAYLIVEPDRPDPARRHNPLDWPVIRPKSIIKIECLT